MITYLSLKRIIIVIIFIIIIIIVTRGQIAVVLSKHENVVFTHIFSCYTMPGKSFVPFVQTRPMTVVLRRNITMEKKNEGEKNGISRMIMFYC